MKKISAITLAGLALTTALLATASAHAASSGFIGSAGFGTVVLASLPIPSPGAVALAALGGLVIMRRKKDHVHR